MRRIFHGSSLRLLSQARFIFFFAAPNHYPRNLADGKRLRAPETHDAHHFATFFPNPYDTCRTVRADLAFETAFLFNGTGSMRRFGHVRA
ncbi:MULTISPECIES: hypothetical protein [Burkholderia]|uniref:hypothetical protein n=1 Tax=Burkholderia TaxID=32008 RepID=UPI001269E688|nr:MULTISPECIES: hypothetical protein [Burkholderia]